MEVDKKSLTLSQYISKYQGNTKFSRLLVIADRMTLHRAEALNLSLEYAIKEKKL